MYVIIIVYLCFLPFWFLLVALQIFDQMLKGKLYKNSYIFQDDLFMKYTCTITYLKATK